MATATQTPLRLDNTNNLNNSMKASTEIPRIDLAKIDNVPYYIESKLFEIF
jgi:hypothetical protein